MNINTLTFRLILSLFLVHFFSLAQENENKHQEKLIHKGAFILSAGSGLNFSSTKTENTSSETFINASVSGLFALSDYFALGGLVTVDGNSAATINRGSLYSLNVGPNVGFFIPNKSPITPYISGAAGLSILFLGGSDTDNEQGYFLDGSLGAIYELNHFVGIGLEYGYSKIDLGGEFSSASSSGLALGVILSF